MATALVVDTDVMVDYLRGRSEAVQFIKSNADRIALSTIVLAELYAGVRDGDEQEKLDNLVSSFGVLPITAEVARMGGLFKRDYGKSHGVGLADALLAATAETGSAELCTLNVKHYPMLKDIKPPYRK